MKKQTLTNINFVITIIKIIIAAAAIAYSMQAKGQETKKERLLHISHKWEDNVLKEVSTEIWLINDNIIVVEDQFFFARMEERISRSIYLIELINENGKTRWMILNMKTRNAFLMKGKKIKTKYFDKLYEDQQKEAAAKAG